MRLAVVLGAFVGLRLAETCGLRAMRKARSEVKGFPAGWPATPAPGRQLADFAGHPAYGLDELRSDQERFVFLLGGSDGEQLFGHIRLSGRR
jgi:hypothetical protein